MFLATASLPDPDILPGLSAFETGTPTFLINLLAETGIPWHCLDGLRASEALLSTFGVGRIAPQALLFQTGYLTVVDGESRGGRLRYRLGFPNREVRESLNRALLDDPLGSGFEREEQETRLLEVPEAADFDGMRDLLRSLLAGIPHQCHGRNPMGGYEGWYASVLYARFAATGADVRAEERGSVGRADLSVRALGQVYVFEFKIQDTGASCPHWPSRKLAATRNDTEAWGSRSTW